MDVSSPLDDKAAFAKRTRELLEVLRVSQRELGRRSGVTGSFVSLVCKAESMPSVPLVAGIRRAFGVSLDWYLLGEGPMFERAPLLLADSGAAESRVPVYVADSAGRGDGAAEYAPENRAMHDRLERLLKAGDARTRARIEGWMDGVEVGVSVAAPRKAERRRR